MQKIYKISSLLLLVVFLIPTTGFYYVRHTCLQSGSGKIVFDGNYSCCQAGSEVTSCCISTDQDKECCKSANLANSFENIHRKCCSNDAKYVKDESQYQKTKKVQIRLFFTYTSLTDSMVHFTESVNKNISPFDIHSKINTSREVLILHSVLII